MANFVTGTIGRADLDGAAANQSFITGASFPQGVAVDGPHVYWANAGTGTIGRADLDGTAANQSFITGASLPIGVAVTPPSTIADLTASVEALGLPRGIERSLLTRLDGAQRNLDAGDLAGACDKLTSFANQVSAQNGKEIGAADAADLIEEAAAVRESLDCGAP